MALNPHIVTALLCGPNVLQGKVLSEEEKITFCVGTGECDGLWFIWNDDSDANFNGGKGSCKKGGSLNLTLHHSSPLSSHTTTDSSHLCPYLNIAKN